MVYRSTEEGYKIYGRLQNHLLDAGVEMKFNTMVKDIIIEDNHVKGVVTDKDEILYADEVVPAVGREGADWYITHQPCSSNYCGLRVL